MKCFHHTDMDGKCAGAIVKKVYPNCEMISINYKDNFPFETIARDEAVFIVDFSLQKSGEFERLLELTSQIIWIDHHWTAIEKHSHLAQQLAGLRRDGISGCELTWEFFYPNSIMPRVVRLLGDYDIHRPGDYIFGEETKLLQVGIRIFDTSPTSLEWGEWLDVNYVPVRELDAGIVAEMFQRNCYASLIKSWAFTTTFEGYSAVACNAGSVPSILFDGVKESFDLMIPFVFDGAKWSVTLYASKPAINVGEIAKKYGGGGHKGAAGFECEVLPFKFESKLK